MSIDSPPPKLTAIGLMGAAVVGLVLRFVVGLEPVWWLAWTAPALLLVLTFTAPERSWRALTSVAALIAVSANVAYYLRVMPVPVVLLVVAGQALLWVLVVSESRRAVLRWRTPWTALAYPVLWVAVDTLMAAVLPDGNWASLAYTQADVLPVMQTASLLGVAGVLFLLSLVPSAVATAVVLGRNTKHMAAMLAGTAALLAAALTFGIVRLATPAPDAPTTRFGLATVDDAIGLEATAPYVNAIRGHYDTHIAALASDGAHVVLLPEKIAVASEGDAAEWQSHLAEQAKTRGVWLSAGMAVQTPDGIVNDAWLFTPQGVLDASYRKQFMAPPERGYLPGRDYVVRQVEGARYGIAICKDMHFASFGRAYGQRQTAVMLVPAWDFTVDRGLGARMTAVRGIENGYLVVRAARDGQMTVTDAHGRILAEQDSGAMPGRRMRVDARVPAPVATLFTRVGNVLGWACVAAAGLLVWRTRVGRRPSHEIAIARPGGEVDVPHAQA